MLMKILLLDINIKSEQYFYNQNLVSKLKFLHLESKKTVQTTNECKSYILKNIRNTHRYIILMPN